MYSMLTQGLHGGLPSCFFSPYPKPPRYLLCRILDPLGPKGSSILHRDLYSRYLEGSGYALRLEVRWAKTMDSCQNPCCTSPDHNVPPLSSFPCTCCRWPKTVAEHCMAQQLKQPMGLLVLGLEFRASGLGGRVATANLKM